MFSICRQTHPATGIEHAVSCCFFNNEDVCLVTAGANIIKVFRMVPEGHTKEVNAAGQPIPPKMKLECLASYTLWGNVMSMASVKFPSAGRDLLLVSFKEAKLSVLQYDIHTNNLITLSMHYFEEDDMKGGWTVHPHIPWIRVDPEGRCAVMLLYGKKLAVLPFRKDLGTEDGDPLESKPFENKKTAPTQPITRAPTLASYVIVLKDLDEKIDNILDIQFLHGYYEPTLLLLYEPVRTFAGRTAVRNDTCAMAGVSLNMSARVHPVIWQISGLPFDCLQAVPVHKPLGGCLIMAVNSLIYLNQSVPPYGVSLNSIATHTTNFPLRIQEGVCITLDGASVATLGETRLALALKGGQLYVLTLLADSVRSVRAFHLDRAAASVLTCCMCVLEEDFLFLGSRLGNSLLLRVTERENRMLFSVDKPLEATVDLTESEANEENQAQKDGQQTDKDKEKDNEPSNKRQRIDIGSCVASDVVDLSEQDELEVYGSDIRTSTQLTSYVFEVCDSLLNVCPIGSVSMGEPQLGVGGVGGVGGAGGAGGERVELVACAGRDKNGALCVLQRTLTPHLLTAFDLPGCTDMWSVFGENESGRDADAAHAYLLLTQDDSTMVLQTGQEINEVDNSGFISGAPTVFAGNLGNNKFMVQVTSNAIRLVRNGAQIQTIQLEWTALSAHTADPYLCVVSTCGKIMVLALREFRQRDTMTGRLAPTRQSISSRPAVVRATVYRDLSGLFGAPDTPNVQVKGEFTGKMKTGVKAEGFKPGAVYELNDEDELLYGGDQTPASMASVYKRPNFRSLLITAGKVIKNLDTNPEKTFRHNVSVIFPTLGILAHPIPRGAVDQYMEHIDRGIMLAEQWSGARAASCPRRMSRWWRGRLADPKPTYWAAVLRANHSTEIYSLPDMRLCALYRGATTGDRVLADSLESVSTLPEPEELEEEGGVGGPGGVGDTGVRELLLVGMGHKASRVHLFVLTNTDLIVYQAYKYPRGNLRVRFSRVSITFPAGWCPPKPTDPENVRQLRTFSNVGGYSGVFVCGHTPLMTLMSTRGELRVHAVSDPAPPLTAIVPFHNTNCNHGMLYFNKTELRISVVGGHLSYDTAWPARKVPLRMTPHHVSYHLESKTYCLVASVRKPTTTYYKFNGEDKEKSLENKGDRFPYPLLDQFSVLLFSPVSWEIIPNTKIDLDEWEHVTCLKNVSLSYEGTTSGLRGYIAIGTNYNYSEDITSRGRIIIYDIIDVVPEPGQPLTKNRFKELYCRDQKGPVTALTQVLGYLVSAVGQKIYIWQLKDNDLVGIAFIDTGIYVHRLLAIKNLIVVCDVYKSVSLLRYQDQHRTLSLVSRDLRNAQIYDIEFMVDNTNLGFLVSEAEGNFALFMYQPHARESYGGQRLIKKCDYHLGQQVHAMFRIAAKPVPEVKHRRHVTMFTTLDGGLGYILPLSEKMYRRLLMLQNVMNNYCCHIAGLNPRAHRTYRGGRRGTAARGILDGDLVYLYQGMPHADRVDIAKKIGTKVEEILADLYEIDRLTAHF